MQLPQVVMTYFVYVEVWFHRKLCGNCFAIEKYVAWKWLATNTCMAISRYDSHCYVGY